MGRVTTNFLHALEPDLVPAGTARESKRHRSQNGLLICTPLRTLERTWGRPVRLNVPTWVRSIASIRNSATSFTSTISTGDLSSPGAATAEYCCTRLSQPKTSVVSSRTPLLGRG